MGIDGDIIKKAKADASQTVQPFFFTQMPSIQGSTAYIEDSLTRVLWNPGESGDWLYTGVQFFDMWFRPFVQQLGQYCTHAVSTFDASENVPKEKSATQLARIIAGNRAAAKRNDDRVSYSEDMLFDDDGIYDPKDKAETMQKFDLRSVQAGPRGLRKSLWNYVFNKLKQTPMPDERTLYFEIDCQSAWKFEGSKEFTRDLTTAHGHGESDPSLGFWLEHTCFGAKEGKTAILKSKDGDLVPILLHAIDMQEKHAWPDYVRKPVYWVSKFNEIYEMRAYLRFVKTKYKFTESQYMIFCILCGTDYFEKKLICAGFGMPKIFDAFESTKNEFNVWDTPLQKDETQEQRDAKEELSLYAFVRQLYQNNFTGTSKGLMAVVRNKNNGHVDFAPKLYTYERLVEISDKKGNKKIVVPSRENINKAYRQLSFNYRYWRDRTRWPKGMYGTLPPEERSAAQFMTPLRKVQAQPEAAAGAAASSSSAAGAAASSSDVKATELKLERPIIEQRPPFAHRPTFGILEPRPRTMRTSSQADLDDAAQKLRDNQQRECMNMGSPTKKPRVSLAAMLPQYAVPPTTPEKPRASPPPEEIARLDADEEAAGDELMRLEAEADEWEIVHESKNQIAAMQLVADLDEAAARISNLSPPPIVPEQRSTRNSCKNTLVNFIRRASRIK